MITWKEAFASSRFKIQLLITLLSLILLGIIMPTYFEKVIHCKPGIYLEDALLNMITPHDVSWYIFGTIYSCILTFSIINIKNPKIVLLVCALYSGVTWLRMVTMYIFTIEAPEGIIPLKDPFLALFIYNKPEFVKDFFFSGHVSTMITLAVTEPRKRIKILYYIIAFFIAVLLLIQHVHYTIDVIFAPFFTYLLYVTLKSVAPKFEYPRI